MKELVPPKPISRIQPETEPLFVIDGHSVSKSYLY